MLNCTSRWILPTPKLLRVQTCSLLRSPLWSRRTLVQQRQVLISGQDLHTVRREGGEGNRGVEEGEAAVIKGRIRGGQNGGDTLYSYTHHCPD